MKKYTKRQISEAISYWNKMLAKLDENISQTSGRYLYITKNNPSFAGNVRKVGASGIKKLEDQVNVGENLSTKLLRYSTCVPVSWEAAYVIALEDDYDSMEPSSSATPALNGKTYMPSIADLEQKLFAAIEEAGGKRYSNKELFDVDDATIDDVVQQFVADNPGTYIVQ